MSSLIESFVLQTSDPGVNIVGRKRGSGPPLLLLHGNPLTQLSWERIAPRLAEQFTVVTTDLRGYGDSDKPEGLPDHSNYSFRRMAQDQVDVMQQLGFEKFALAGHDRGARTAFRLAMDDKLMKQSPAKGGNSHFRNSFTNRYTVAKVAFLGTVDAGLNPASGKLVT